MRTFVHPPASSQEEFDGDAFVREIDALIAEMHAKPPAPPTRAEIHAFVERTFASIARMCGITLAPLPAPVPLADPEPMPEPELQPALTLAGWIEFASANRTSSVPSHDIWEAYWGAKQPQTKPEI